LQTVRLVQTLTPALSATQDTTSRANRHAHSVKLHTALVVTRLEPVPSALTIVMGPLVIISVLLIAKFVMAQPAINAIQDITRAAWGLARLSASTATQE
jgi:hypothetical protein